MIQLFFWVSELSEIHIILCYFLLSCCGGVLGWLCKAGHKSSPLARAEYAALIFSAQFAFTCPQAAFVLGAYAIAYNVLPLLFAITFGAAILNGYFLYSFSHRRGADIAPGKMNTVIAFIPFGILYYCFAAGDKYNTSRKHSSTANLKPGTALLVIWALVMIASTKVVERQLEFIEGPMLTASQENRFDAAFIDGLGLEAYLQRIADRELELLPIEAEQGLWLTHIEVAGTGLAYIYELKPTFELSDTIETYLNDLVCGQSGYVTAMNHGAVLMFRYFDANGTLLYFVDITVQDCLSA